MWISEKVVVRIIISFLAFIVIMFLLSQGKKLLFEQDEGKLEIKVGVGHFGTSRANGDVRA